MYRPQPRRGYGPVNGPPGAGNSRRLRERVDDERLEAGDEALGHRKQSALLEQPARDSQLDPLDELRVLGADLGIEGEHLLDPRVVGVRSDEVVEETARAVGRDGHDRADREVRSAG